MARSSSSKSRRSSQAKSKVQSDLAKLRKVGLTKARLKPKSRPGGSAYALLRKFKDVLQGKAAVVSAPKSSIKEYSERFRTTRTKIVIPKAIGEKPYLQKSTGQIKISKKISPKQPRLKVIVPPKGTLQSLPRGPGYRYALVFPNHTITFLSYELLEQFLTEYKLHDEPSKIYQFVKVIPPAKRRVSNDEDIDDLEEDEE